MRGTPDDHVGHFLRKRIIPAYAGNTASLRSQSARTEDHPRVCGEHRPFGRRLVASKGSSPRMRGTPVASVTIRSMAGIIPAYAGNTHVWPTRPASDRDHPRVCGEHIVNLSFQRFQTGSSPRMRGTQKHPRGTVGAEGIIPAYAGNTSNCHMGRALARDHPRVCGEHRQGGKYGTNGIGSSPRMRGTPSRPSWA